MKLRDVPDGDTFSWPCGCAGRVLRRQTIHGTTHVRLLTACAKHDDLTWRHGVELYLHGQDVLYDPLLSAIRDAF